LYLLWFVVIEIAWHLTKTNGGPTRWCGGPMTRAIGSARTKTDRRTVPPASHATQNGYYFVTWSNCRETMSLLAFLLGKKVYTKDRTIHLHDVVDLLLVFALGLVSV